MDRVTFATSPGIVWLALAAHFAAGLDVAPRVRCRLSGIVVGATQPG